MGKQIGFQKLTGTLGDINYYKSKGKYYMRMKPGPNAKQFKTHDAFNGSRKRSMEFGYASKKASELKTLIQGIEPRLPGKALYQLLFMKLRKIQSLDTSHAPGEKIILAEHQKPLRNIQLNASVIAGEISRLFALTFKKEATNLHLTIKAFWTDFAAAIPDATHYKWKVGLIYWNPNTNKSSIVMKETEKRSIQTIPYPTSVFTFPKPGDETTIALPVISFQCYTEDNRLTSEKIGYTVIL